MAGRLEEARSPTVEGKVAGNWMRQVAELGKAGRRKLVRQVADVDQAMSPGTE